MSVSITNAGVGISVGKQDKTADGKVEHFLRATLNALSTGIAVLDERGTVLDANQAWRDAQCAPDSPVIHGGVGSNFLLTGSAAVSEGSKTGVAMAEGICSVISGQAETFSLEYPCLGGVEEQWWSARVTRFVDGGSLRIVVVCDDITGRKRAEAKRSWEQMFLQAQANSALDGILVVNPRGEKILQNQRCIDLWKIPSHIANSGSDEEQIRWVLGMTRHPETFLAGVTHLYAHPKEKSRDEIALKDGTYLDRYSAPVLGEDGTLYGRIWTFRDITERKRMEESLRKSEARFQRMTDNVPGMVYRMVLRADGQVMLPFVSEGCRKIYGLDPQEVQNDARLMTDLVHPEDRDERDRTVAASVATLAPWSWRGRIRRADTGEIRHVQGASQPERQPNGDIVWDGVLVDITEIKQAEELRRAKKEAERLNEGKSEFLSRVSHELRTPLNAILGFGQVLELSPLGEQDEQCVQYILKGGRHLLSLVDEVLDLTRAETGKLSLHLTTFSFARLMHECVGLTSKMAEARGISSQAEMSSACQTPVRADEQRVRQVLLNLLANAIKYNRQGGRVVVSCQVMPGAKLRCQVEDTGEGISPEGLTRLFVPFERLGKELGDTTGTGLGLVVSRRLAEAMGGTVGGTSQLDVGSTFWVEIPIAASLEADPVDGATLAVVAATDPEASSTATVLYIEDNRSNLEVMQTAARRLRPHWRFSAATDGIKGLQAVREQRPDVVLLDLQIPGLAGDAVLAALRADPSTTRLPVLLLSADATAQSRERLLALGANGYLTKPFKLAEVIEKIDGLLASFPDDGSGGC